MNGENLAPQTATATVGTMSTSTTARQPLAWSYRDALGGEAMPRSAMAIWLTLVKKKKVSAECLGRQVDKRLELQLATTTSLTRLMQRQNQLAKEPG